jgi:undecaprenyl-diphosphatase
MTWFQAVVLALIQGITEFLPVSSSAHLILVPVLTGWTDQGLDFDVVVHAGTLVAIVAYFRTELAAMARDWLRSLTGGGETRDSRLAWWVIVGTIPAGFAGMLLKDDISSFLRSPLLLAIGLIAFGILLGVADWRSRGTRDEYSLTLRDVVVIGLAQALALFPGTSRSGITMTAALFLGLSREAAARFSFLLAVPIIAAATLFVAVDLLHTEVDTDWAKLALAFVLAAASAYAVVHFFLAFIRRMGMQPFVGYRIALGAVLIFAFY